jgi:hypothetical protein
MTTSSAMPHMHRSRIVTFQGGAAASIIISDEFILK